MSYGTIETLTEVLDERSLVQLTDDAHTGELRAAVAQAVLDSAQQLVDGYLRGRVTLPLPESFPDRGLIVRLERDIAVRDLYRRRGAVPEEYVEAAIEAERKLEKIQRGVIVLDLGDGGPTQPRGGGIRTDKTASDRVWTRDVLAGF